MGAARSGRCVRLWRCSGGICCSPQQGARKGWDGDGAAAKRRAERQQRLLLG
jgi:hypothetical protein